MMIIIITIIVLEEGVDEAVGHVAHVGDGLGGNITIIIIIITIISIIIIILHIYIYIHI